MTSTGSLGSCDDAARRAAGALIEQGWSRLAAAVGGEVARFGGVNWQTDSALREKLRRPDGKLYHRESIARARRWLRDAGLISSTRIMMGEKIPGAKYNGGRSTRGTTLKTFHWRALSLKNPFSRRERKRVRIEQAKASRAAGELVPRHSSAYRHAESPTVTPRRYELDPETAELARRAQAASEARAARQHAGAAARPGPVPVRVAAPERPPPD